MMRASLVIGCGILFLCLLLGCGEGAFSPLTGGSVPIGGIDGWVYSSPGRAVTGASPQANTLVELLAANGNLLQTTITNGQGYFLFRNVPKERVLVRAAAGTLAGRLEVDHTDNQPVVIKLLIVSTMPDPSQYARLQLRPVNPVVVIGKKVDFTAQGVATPDNALVDVPVSWALHGNVGDLHEDGEFLAERAGTGQVIAQAGELKAVTTVTVIKKAEKD